jgi:type IV secretion system protein VirB4
MIPLSAVWAGPERNEHLGGPPLLFAKTDGATPFRLSLHVGDVGHTLVVGPTGAGKSVLLALIALQFRAIRRPRSSPSISGLDPPPLAMRAATGTISAARSPETISNQPHLRRSPRSMIRPERAWAAEWLAAI